MQLEIVTPEKIILNEEIEELTIPTVQGEISVLPNHINLLTRVSPGEMVVVTKGKTQYLAVTGGFLEIHNNKITLLADFAVRSEEVDSKKALDAQKRAEDLLRKKDESISQRDLALAQSELTKALMSLKVANRRRRPSNIPGQ